MREPLRDLLEMFSPLEKVEQRRWARILSLPEAGYVSALEQEASKRGLRQRLADGAVSWLDDGGHQLVLLFRVEDPSSLAAVRRVYDTIAVNDAPLAYTFVQQIPDGRGTWDIFHMSRLTYLSHCNRVSGPGSEDETGP
jgi:hypothetical protein